MPGLTTKQMGTGSYTWLLHTHGIREATSGAVDISAFTAGTHYPDGFLPSGLPVDVTNPKGVLPYTGTGKLAFVMGDHPTDGVEDRNIAFLTHGQIRTDFVPNKTVLPSTAPNGFYFTKGA